MLWYTMVAYGNHAMVYNGSVVEPMVAHGGDCGTDGSTWWAWRNHMEGMAEPMVASWNRSMEGVAMEGGHHQNRRSDPAKNFTTELHHREGLLQVPGPWRQIGLGLGVGFRAIGL